MAAFATHSDLAARWRSLSTGEQTRATTLLGDASAELRALDNTIDQRIEDDLLDADIPKRVVCQMVKRAMIGDANEGLNQFSETTGPFTNSGTFANPNGDLYLTKNERKLLGIGKGRAFSIDLAPHE